jgi:hypothetical protein
VLARPEATKFQIEFLDTLSDLAERKPKSRGGKQGKEFITAGERGLVDLESWEFRPAFHNLFRRREPDIGIGLQSVHPDDPMKPANPPLSRIAEAIQALHDLEPLYAAALDALEQSDE